MQGCMIEICIYKHDGPMAKLLLWAVFQVSSNEFNGVAFVKKRIILVWNMLHS